MTASPPSSATPASATPAIPEAARHWRVGGGRILRFDERPLIMGVVNVTPDSFSDGGLHLDPDRAVAHGRALVAAGADIVDVGGESTRPGADPVGAGAESARVVPVVEQLAGDGTVVSVDTSKPEVAEAAIAAGAAIVNDVAALTGPGMLQAVAATDAGVVLMHMQGDPRTMQLDPHYQEVVDEVGGYLVGRARHARDAGIAGDRVCLDPGIGFGKTVAHNLELLRRLPELVGAGFPVALGVSRKSFLAKVLGPLSLDERDEATAGVTALATLAGVAVIRVHDVERSVRAARLASAIVLPRSQDEGP